MAKQFNVPFDESEVDFLEKFKETITEKGYKSQKEWLKAKMSEEVEVKTDDSATKISDFQDNFIKATPPFYAKRSVWIGYLVASIVKDEEATKEFESRMRMLAKDWNRIFGMKDNIARLKMYVENPQSVRWMS